METDHLRCIDSLQPTMVRVGQGNCHIWQWKLTDCSATLAALLQVLSADEQHRAHTFLAQPARDTFVQVRAVLRLLLAERLDMAAADIRFQYGKFRKPALLENSSDSHFNVAHSGDYALIAVAQGYEVGVDIERMRAPRDLASLAEIIMSPAEMQRWRKLPDQARIAAFFFAWTAKEAVSKAVGQGLQLDFATLDTGIGQDGDTCDGVQVIAGEYGPCAFCSLAVPDGYSAALALRLAA